MVLSAWGTAERAEIARVELEVRPPKRHCLVEVEDVMDVERLSTGSATTRAGGPDGEAGDAGTAVGGATGEASRMGGQEGLLDDSPVAASRLDPARDRRHQAVVDKERMIGERHDRHWQISCKASPR